VLREKIVLREKTVTLDCGELAYLETGLEPSSGESAEVTVLFLHGWLDNAASFSTLIEQCQKRIPDAHFVAVDFPGHGNSQHRKQGNFYPFHDYIDDVYQFLPTLSANKLIIVGHSLGALVGCCYSAAFPEQVAGLVQIEGFGPLAEAEENAVDRLRKGVLSREKLRRKPKRRFNSLQDMVRIRASVNSLAEQEIFPVVERASEFDGENWRWKHDNRLQSDSLYRMSEKHAQLMSSAIRCPQTIILGEQGFDYLRRQTEQNLSNNRDDINKSKEVHIIAGGHHCHLQQPELTSEIIADLVNKI